MLIFSLISLFCSHSIAAAEKLRPKNLEANISNFLDEHFPTSHAPDLRDSTVYVLTDLYNVISVVSSKNSYKFYPNPFPHNRSFLFLIGLEEMISKASWYNFQNKKIEGKNVFRKSLTMPKKLKGGTL